MSGHLPSGGGQPGSRLHISPNAPTPKQLFSTARLLHPGSYRSETGAAGGAGGTGRRLRVSGGGRGDAPDPPRAPPPAGSGPHARHRLQARPAEHPRPQRRPQPGAGSRMWPGPATALPGPPTRLPAPDSGSRPPPSRPAPSPRGGQRVPGGALPADAERGPGARPEELGRGGCRGRHRTVRPSHAGPRAPEVGGGRYPSPHPGRRLPTRTPHLPSSGSHKSQKDGPTPEREPESPQNSRRGS